MISPSVRMMKRMTPWVDGCCGPMLRVISSPESVARMSSLIGLSRWSRLALLGRCFVEGGQELEHARAGGVHAAVRLRLLVVLAHGMARPIVWHQDAPQVG